MMSARHRSQEPFLSICAKTQVPEERGSLRPPCDLQAVVDAVVEYCARILSGVSGQGALANREKDLLSKRGGIRGLLTRFRNRIA